jgi:hypothetical protein
LRKGCVHRLSIIGKKDREADVACNRVGTFSPIVRSPPCPTGIPEALGSLFTGMADMGTVHDTYTSAVHERLFGDMYWIAPLSFMRSVL